jgi:hypothetical protein
MRMMQNPNEQKLKLCGRQVRVMNSWQSTERDITEWHQSMKAAQVGHVSQRTAKTEEKREL